ncbi:MAG: GNAT family N-acetyltransferase [Clostridiales bacterium]|nr:GNAT family N-acetyltransferase [Clostridiales bacterium]
MFRKMQQGDRALYHALATEFYNTDAILTEPDEALFEASFQEMMRRDTYLEGFVLEHEGESAGYAILAKYFSPELGGLLLWVDELYIRPGFRSHGLGSAFLSYVQEQYGDKAKRIRLEVDVDNERAISLYHSMGFEVLPYQQMTLDPSI